MEKMMRITKEEVQAFLRRDFVAFVERGFYELNPETEYLHNWHIDVIAEALEQCRSGKLRRLIINVPPRSLKSHMTSVSFVSWLLGHNPAAQIICASYAQDLADKLAGDCRSLMAARWYQDLFPATRLAMRRQAVHDFMTSEKGFRLATSVGGVLTGRGADFIIIDDPLKPDEALSEVQRNAVNNWFDHTLISRLNDKRNGCIILIMQRLHEDDLVGHVLKQGDWKVLKFPAIAEENETQSVQTAYGKKTFSRQIGEALHPEREPLEVLATMRETQGEYNFAGQYQQAPAPLGGGMIKTHWFKVYRPEELPKQFELVVQSWDTANKSSELNDYSVCTTWGMVQKNLYLLYVLRKRMEYPELRRVVKEHARTYKARNVVIEDKASGTQLIQDLCADGIHGVTRYNAKLDKVMRMHSVTSTIENGFVYIPEKADWLPQYMHEMAVFPNGKYDDQVDSTSQALDWAKDRCQFGGLIEIVRQEAARLGSLSALKYGNPNGTAEPPIARPATPYCERCGRPVGRCSDTGPSADTIETCVSCGHIRRIPCRTTIRTVTPSTIPTFRDLGPHWH
jgi:predicted phage terminase large subunit-like protein